MSYKTLMVHLDVDGSNDSRLRVAGELASTFAAAVIGIAAAEFAPSPYFTTGRFADSYLDRQRAQLERTLAELERAFRAALHGHARSIEWRSALALPDRFVAGEVRAADLIVVGPRPEGMIVDPVLRLSASDLVMHAGRPILVVPPEASRFNGEHVMIGWKDTREARRAVRDALGLLKAADEITIVEMLQDETERDAARRRLDDVRQWLDRHGIASGAMTPVATGADDQLTSVAGEIGAGVIVAGAYGHRRLREWMFGGVTRELLSRPKQCVLLSH